MHVFETTRLIAKRLVRDEGRSVSSVARELKVSRKAIYSWLKKNCLKNKYEHGKSHHCAKYPKALPFLISKIVAHPEWGCRVLEKELAKDGIDLSYVQINHLLNKLGAQNYQKRASYAQSLYKKPYNKYLPHP